MKAAVFRGVGRPLSVESVPDPAPGAGEIVLEVARCGICGSDLHLTEDAAYARPLGTVLGHEMAGEVVAVGAGVDDLRVGDRVAGFPLAGCGTCDACRAGEVAWCSQRRLLEGGFAQYALLRARGCVALPPSISVEDGALVEPMAVALHGVRTAALPAGARVLVLGAGPIGLATSFWAKRLGASRVAVAELAVHCEPIARAMGADAFLLGCRDTPAALAVALGGAPDVVFECVGRPGLLAQAIDLVRPRGTVSLLGLCMANDSLVPAAAVRKELRIQAAAFFSIAEFRQSLDVFEAGHIEARHMITDRVSLAGMPQAFEALRARTTQCKVLVDATAA